MAIQVWTHPRADLNTMTGGRALAEGVASLGNLGDAIEKAMQRKKDEAQLATVLRKKHSILQPDRKDEFQTMSLGDLIGEDKGFVAKAIERDQQQKLDVEKAQLAHYLEQQAQAKRAPAFFQRLSESGQAPESVPAPLSNAEFDRRTAPLDARALFEAAAATGYNPGGQTDDLLRAIQSGTKSFDPSAVINLPGAPGYKKTQTSAGQFQVIPPRELPEDKEPTIRIGVGEPNLLGQYPNTLTVTPSQYKKHKAALDELGFKLQPVGENQAAGAKPAAQDFKKGDRARQNGIIYEFNGKDWQPVQ